MGHSVLVEDETLMGRSQFFLDSLRDRHEKLGYR